MSLTLALEEFQKQLDGLLYENKTVQKINLG